MPHPRRSDTTHSLSLPHNGLTGWPIGLLAEFTDRSAHVNDRPSLRPQVSCDRPAVFEGRITDDGASTGERHNVTTGSSRQLRGFERRMGWREPDPLGHGRTRPRARPACRLRLRQARPTAEAGSSAGGPPFHQRPNEPEHTRPRFRGRSARPRPAQPGRRCWPRAGGPTPPSRRKRPLRRSPPSRRSRQPPRPLPRQNHPVALDTPGSSTVWATAPRCHFGSNPNTGSTRTSTTTFSPFVSTSSRAPRGAMRATACSASPG